MEEGRRGGGGGGGSTEGGGGGGGRAGRARSRLLSAPCNRAAGCFSRQAPPLEPCPRAMPGHPPQTLCSRADSSAQRHRGGDIPLPRSSPPRRAGEKAAAPLASGKSRRGPGARLRPLARPPPELAAPPITARQVRSGAGARNRRDQSQLWAGPSPTVPPRLASRRAHSPAHTAPVPSSLREDRMAPGLHDYYRMTREAPTLWLARKEHGRSFRAPAISRPDPAGPR